jgi:hypothetical protein
MAQNESLIEDSCLHRRLRRCAPWLVLLALLALVATPGWLYGLSDGWLVLRPMPVLVLEHQRLLDRGSDAELLAQPQAPQ